MKHFIIATVLVTAFLTTFYSFAEKQPKDLSVMTPSQENKVYPIAIIGSGAGGTMAIKRAILYNREALLFTGAKKEMKRSRGHWVKKVDNIPGLEKYSRALVELRQETLKDLKEGPFGHNLFVVEDSVISIEKQQNIFKITDQTGHSYLARFVVLATGMMDEQPHIMGSIRPVLSYANKQTIAYCLLCDGHRSFQKKTVIIGHSEEAAKAALLLANRYQPSAMTILTNGKEVEFSESTTALLEAKKIFVEKAPIEKILGEEGLLAGFQLLDDKTIEAEIGFVMLGIRPNNGLALAIGAQVDERGLVISDKNGETSIPNLFVVGDLRAGSMKQIYTAWQNAVDSLQIIDQRLRTDQIIISN